MATAKQVGRGEAIRVDQAYPPPGEQSLADLAHKGGEGALDDRYSLDKCRGDILLLTTLLLPPCGGGRRASGGWGVKLIQSGRFTLHAARKPLPTSPC